MNRQPHAIDNEGDGWMPAARAAGLALFDADAKATCKKIVLTDNGRDVGQG